MNDLSSSHVPHFFPEVEPTIGLWQVWQEVQGSPNLPNHDHVQDTVDNFGGEMLYRRKGIGRFTVEFRTGEEPGWYAVGEHFIAGPYSHAVEAFTFNDSKHQAYYFQRLQEKRP